MDERRRRRRRGGRSSATWLRHLTGQNRNHVVATHDERRERVRDPHAARPTVAFSNLTVSDDRFP